VRGKDLQELQNQSEALEQAHASLKRDHARSTTELDISNRDLEKAKREIASLRETQSSLEEQLADACQRGMTYENEGRERSMVAERAAAESELLKKELAEVKAKLDDVEMRESKASAGWAAAAGQVEILQVDKAHLESGESFAGREEEEEEEERGGVESKEERGGERVAGASRVSRSRGGVESKEERGGERVAGASRWSGGGGGGGTGEKRLRVSGEEEVG